MNRHSGHNNVTHPVGENKRIRCVKPVARREYFQSEDVVCQATTGTLATVRRRAFLTAEPKPKANTSFSTSGELRYITSSYQRDLDSSRASISESVAG
jgi:hypothetical protein